MATVTGSIVSAVVVREPDAATETVLFTVKADCGETQLATVSGSRPLKTAQQVPSALVGLEVEITVDDESNEPTAIAVTFPE